MASSCLETSKRQLPHVKRPRPRSWVVLSGLGVSDLEEFLVVHEKCKSVYSKGHCPRTAKYEISFHVFLAKKTGNPILVMMLDFVNSLMADCKTALRPGREFSRKVLEAHDRIVEAIKAGDGEAAAAHMLAHVSNVEAELEALKIRRAEHPIETPYGMSCAQETKPAQNTVPPAPFDPII